MPLEYFEVARLDGICPGQSGNSNWRYSIFGGGSKVCWPGNALPSNICGAVHARGSKGVVSALTRAVLVQSDLRKTFIMMDLTYVFLFSGCT